MATMDSKRVVQVNDLTVRFKTPDRVVEAVRNVSFHVDRGETLAIVGESGSGKSVTSLALMRLVEYGGGRIVNGGMLLRRRSGEVLDLVAASDATLQRVRGADVAMIFQEPMTSLNPSFTAGNQIAEALRLHQGLDAAAARAETLRMLERVRIPEARAILDRYPHQLSGGMRQRVMIAMALSCKPQLLIADEPTTALDVTIQAQILQLIRQLQEEMDMGVIFITHDMGVVAEVADRVLVMYRGDKVEEGGSDAVFARPQHAYTRARCRRCCAWGHARHGRARAISAAARGRRGQGRAASVGSSPGPCRPALDRAARERPGAEGARPYHHFRHHRRHPGPGAEARARGREGQFRPVPRRDAVAGGRVRLRQDHHRPFAAAAGQEPGRHHRIRRQEHRRLRGSAMQTLRQHIQFIFQDPFASLDPRMTVGYSIMEPLLIHGVARGKAAEERVRWLMDKCGLLPEMIDRYPHEFSGGQRQRICIARALALNPAGGDRRRIGVGAGRVDPGADREPAAGPAARAGRVLPVHLA